MALDPTARESNIRDSIKKYFVDSLEGNGHLSTNTVMFDKGLSIPNLRNKTLDRWVSVNFAPLEIANGMARQDLAIFCATRDDNEGFKLAQLRDTVVGYLTDSTVSDGMARVPLYRSRATGSWTLLGYMLAKVELESGQFVDEDETKYKQISVSLHWGCRF